jgi:hypothetical protein
LPVDPSPPAFSPKQLSKRTRHFCDAARLCATERRGKISTGNSRLGAPIFRHFSANQPIPRHCYLWQRDTRHSVRWIAANMFGGLSGAKRLRNQPIIEISASNKKFLLDPNC